MNGKLLLAAGALLAAISAAWAHQPPSRTAGTTTGNGNSEAPFEVRIELPASVHPASIDVDQPFRVVITNTSDKDVSISSSNPRDEYGQLAVQFRNLRTGTTAIARRREIYAPQYWPRRIEATDADVRRIRIGSRGVFVMDVRLGDFVLDTPVWIGVPDPNSSHRFALRAVLVSRVESSTAGVLSDDPAVWIGEVRSPEVLAALTADRIKTPHEYLRSGFPNRAVELMKADRTWIGRLDDAQCTPLHHAARVGSLAAVKWLLDNGANVDAINRNGFTPLSLAEDRDTIALILTRHPNLKIPVESQTPLQHAARQFKQARNETDRRKWQEIFELYLQAGADEDLMTALEMRHVARVKKLVTASPELADNFQGESLLRKAAAMGSVELCRFLIDNYRLEIDDFKRGVGYPILHGALAHPEVVRLLIEQGADLQTRITYQGLSRTGFWAIGDDATLLHYAAETGVPETVKLLLDHGVDLFATAKCDDKEQPDQTALDVAADFGRADNVIAMLEHPRFQRASPEVRKRQLNRCLVTAVQPFGTDGSHTQRAVLIAALLKHGADANLGERGLRAMHAAAEGIWPNGEQNKDLKQAVAALAQHGVALDLFCAVALGDEKEVGRILSANPSTVDARNSRGFPALHLAIAMNYDAIVRRLLDGGCDLEIRNHSDGVGDLGDTPLHAAAFWGRYDMAKDFIARGANVNATSRKRWTPLHDAAYARSAKVARLLLEKGARADAETSDGETPLALARHYGAGKNVAEIEATFAEFQNKRGQPAGK
jgi:ankyrin repeat protein